jgi:hypothetical protein
VGRSAGGNGGAARAGAAARLGARAGARAGVARAGDARGWRGYRRRCSAGAARGGGGDEVEADDGLKVNQGE